MEISRRDFLRYTGMATGGAMATGLKLRFLEAQTEIPNPLEHYPDRNWEKVYRDQYSYDRTFTFCCVPNDTHNCRLKAFVRNGVVTRIEQNYDSHLVEDLHGVGGRSDEAKDGVAVFLEVRPLHPLAVVLPGNTQLREGDE